MWFWWALLSSVLGATEVVISKKVLERVKAPLFTWTLFGLSLPFLTVLTALQRRSEISFLFFVGTFGSALVFTFSKTLASHSIKHSRLSKIYPLGSFTALFSYLFGLLFLSETLNLQAVVGLLVTILGAYIFNAQRAKEGLLEPLKVLVSDRHNFIYLTAVILGSLASVLDKTGLNATHPTNVYLTLLTENAFMSLLLFPYVLINDERWVNDLIDNFTLLLLSSLLYMVVVLTVFSGFAAGPIALTLAVKRIQVFIVFLLSFALFKDKPPKAAWLGTVIMILGVILIKLS